MEIVRICVSFTCSYRVIHLYFSLPYTIMPELAADSTSETLNNTGGAPQVHSDSIQHFRELAQPFKHNEMIPQDGGLLIKGVKLLASGTWTDSAVGTPLFYPPNTLRECAGNWTDQSGWARHSGNVPRGIDDLVSDVRNLQFNDDAVVGDLFVHGKNQKSRDLMEMIRCKLIKAVSVEHGGSERFNQETRQMEAATLTFTGYAWVNKGACTKCRINEAPKETPVIAPVEEPMTDTKELEAQIAGLTKELEAVKAQKPAEVKAEIPKELAALPGAMKELSDKFEARIKALETEGTPKTGTGQTKELESMPEFSVHVDRKHGIVGA